MERVLQIVAVAVLVILAGFLVPLLLQLYRTARAVEALAKSAQEDLKQMAQDIHLAGLQMEKVADLAQKSLEFPATASAMGARLLDALSGPLGRSWSPWLEALVTAVKIGLDYFLRPRKAAPAEEKRDE